MSTELNPIAAALDDDDDDDEPPLLVVVESNDESVVDEVQRPSSSGPTGTSSSASSLPACPVSILSGFLGSGKTTLIQHILRSPNHGKRIAVIENEFGEGLAVESLIARDGANEESLTDLIELPNGCICCTVKDSLVATLESLLSKRSDLDYILIEASGMANPGPIASVFWLDDALESRLRLDGIVTIVDASNVVKQLQDTEEASQQIAYADRILLNKIDLLDNKNKEEESSKLRVDDILSTVRSINATAQIQTTTYSNVPDLDWILDSKSFDNLKAQELIQELANVQAPPPDQKPHDHSHDHDHQDCHDSSCTHSSGQSTAAMPNNIQDHIHTGTVTTIALSKTGSIDLKKMNSWLASILWPNQDEQDKVLRARLELEMQKQPQDKEPQQQQQQQKQKPQEHQTIFRMKGILSVKHPSVKEYLLEEAEHLEKEDVDPSSFLNVQTGIDSRRYIVQAVYDLWNIYPASDGLKWEDGNTNDEKRESKVIVIGRFLQHKELKEGFNSCFV